MIVVLLLHYLLFHRELFALYCHSFFVFCFFVFAYCSEWLHFWMSDLQRLGTTVEGATPSSFRGINLEATRLDLQIDKYCSFSLSVNYHAPRIVKFFLLQGSNRLKPQAPVSLSKQRVASSLIKSTGRSNIRLVRRRSRWQQDSFANNRDRHFPRHFYV